MMRKINNLVGIVGRISSGKSFLANKIASDHNLQIVSFGRYLYEFSMANKMPVDRTSLQDLGESYIQKNAAEFLYKVLDHFEPLSNTIVIEGIRHKVIFDLLQNEAENSFFIYIDEDTGVRFQRYVTRDKESDRKVSFDEFIEVDNHPVEHQIEDIRKMCDCEISSTISDEELKILVPYL